VFVWHGADRVADSPIEVPRSRIPDGRCRKMPCRQFVVREARRWLQAVR
jgi:hypothetical protein